MRHAFSEGIFCLTQGLPVKIFSDIYSLTTTFYPLHSSSFCCSSPKQSSKIKVSVWRMERDPCHCVRIRIDQLPTPPTLLHSIFKSPSSKQHNILRRHPSTRHTLTSPTRPNTLTHHEQIKWPNIDCATDFSASFKLRHVARAHDPRSWQDWTTLHLTHSTRHTHLRQHGRRISGSR